MTEPRPIGIRIPRPYATEEEFIQGDGLAIGRMGMILIGAPARPPGIVVRFELLLRNGEAVFRGEGKVVAHRVHANGRQGLEVRFTRLDKHSKALVERVLELRKAGALAPAPANAVPDLSESARLDRASQPDVASIDSPDLARASSPELERASQPEVPPLVEPPDLDRKSSPENAAPPEPAPVPSEPEPPTPPRAPQLHHPPSDRPEAKSSPAIAEPTPAPQRASSGVDQPTREELEPDATVVDTRVAEIEAAASADTVHAELEVEPPLDDAPTPFMPPVIVDERASADGQQPRALSGEGDTLVRLRRRSAGYVAVSDRHAALDRLRSRRSA